jgi:hypothetical protein
LRAKTDKSGICSYSDQPEPLITAALRILNAHRVNTCDLAQLFRNLEDRSNTLLGL